MTHLSGPAVSATVLFCHLAPQLAGEIARGLAHRHGLASRHDLITAAADTLRLAAFEAGLDAADVLRGTGAPGLRLLRPRRSAAAWDALVPQSPEAAPAPTAVQARATAEFAARLDAVAEAAALSAPARAALAAWVVAALLLAHCGPRDAPLGLAELADRL